MKKACIEIDGWRANIRFSSAHIIPRYEKCGRLHGHTYAIHARITGELDENGIVIDFSLVKNTLREITNELDHRVLVPGMDRGVKLLDSTVEIESNGKRYIIPREDCVVLPITSTSAENIANYILDKLVEKLDNNGLYEVEVKVDEGLGQGAKIKRSLR